MRCKNGEKVGLTMRDWPSTPAKESIQKTCAAGVFEALAKPENSEGLSCGEIQRIRNTAAETIKSKLRG